MQLTVEKAIALLGLSSRSMPSTPKEGELLVELVRMWLVEQGEAWVRGNFLLEYEWERHRQKLTAEPDRAPESVPSSLAEKEKVMPSPTTAAFMATKATSGN